MIIHCGANPHHEPYLRHPASGVVDPFSHRFDFLALGSSAAAPAKFRDDQSGGATVFANGHRSADADATDSRWEQAGFSFAQPSRVTSRIVDLSARFRSARNLRPARTQDAGSRLRLYLKIPTEAAVTVDGQPVARTPVNGVKAVFTREDKTRPWQTKTLVFSKTIIKANR